MGNYKTNWQLTETVMPEDFNRIEENIKENNKNHAEFKTGYDKTLKEQNKKIDAKSEKSDVVLKVPQRLTSTDLNTIVIGGNYVIDNATNSPARYGRLVVLQWDSYAKWVTQILYSDTTNEIYTRCSLNEFATNWTPWQKLISINESDSRYYRTDKGIVTDFNLCVNTGMYKVANPQNFKNGPTGCSTYGTLEVIEYNGTSETTQRYIDANGNMFTRFKNNGNGGTWLDWVKIYSSSNKPTAYDIGALGKSEIAVDSTRLANRTLGEVVPLKSLRDFTNGTLIRTSIDASDGTPFLLEVTGNSYGGGLPLDLKVQGYLYNGDTINYSAISTGNTNFTSIDLFRYQDKLCFWLPRHSYWQGFTVKCDNLSIVESSVNRVVAIEDSTRPIEIDKLKSIPITTVYHEGNKPTWTDVVAKPGNIQLTKLTTDTGTCRNITGQDLNSITGMGYYDGLNLVNAPNNEWWYVEVITHSNSEDYILQIATTLTGKIPTIYKRIRDKGIWGSWTQIYNESQVYNTHQSDSRYFIQNQGVVSDFNSAKIPGIYTISGHNIPNAPQTGNLYGTLEVIPRGSDFIQRVSLSGGEIFTRYYGNDSIKWRPWVVVYTSGNKPFWNDVQNKPASYTPASHEHDVLYARKNNGEVSDFNNCLNAGVYSVGSASDIPNAPYIDPGMGIYGTLEITLKGNELIQRFTSNICKIFVRFRNYEGTWSAWNKCVSDKDYQKGDTSDQKHYTIYPDGTCIQWGQATITFAGAYTNAKGYVYYLVPFKEGSSNICTGNIATNSWTGFSDVTGSVVEDNLSRAFIEVRRVDGQSPGDGKSVRVNWIAIGRV